MACRPPSALAGRCQLPHSEQSLQAWESGTPCSPPALRRGTRGGDAGVRGKPGCPVSLTGSSLLCTQLQPGQRPRGVTPRPVGGSELAQCCQPGLGPRGPCQTDGRELHPPTQRTAPTLHLLRVLYAHCGTCSNAGRGLPLPGSGKARLGGFQLLSPPPPPQSPAACFAPGHPPQPVCPAL